MGWAGPVQVSVVSAGVDSVPDYNYRREVVPDASVVLDVVKPSGHVNKQLLLLDGQVQLCEERENGSERLTYKSEVDNMNAVHYGNRLPTVIGRFVS